MKVTPKVLFRELRATLDAPLAVAGFQLADPALGWAKRAGEGFLGVWFQCDKWGWDADWGSSFTVEFQFGPAPVQGISGATGKRIGYLLEGFPELDELRRRNNEVIARLPGTTDGKLEVLRAGDTEIVMKGYRVDPAPAVYGRDIWLHYHSVADARAWAGYFRESLAHFIGLFERGELSAEGAATLRYHEAMGRAQAVPTAEEARRILEDYARTEPDAHYSAIARRVLDPVDDQP